MDSGFFMSTDCLSLEPPAFGWQPFSGSFAAISDVLTIYVPQEGSGDESMTHIANVTLSEAPPSPPLSPPSQPSRAHPQGTA
jgi:hypothetical protein